MISANIRLIKHRKTALFDVKLSFYWFYFYQVNYTTSTCTLVLKKRVMDDLEMKLELETNSLL